MICKKCGTENENNVNFCKNCGQPINNDNNPVSGKTVTIHTSQLTERVEKMRKNKVLLRGMAVIAALIVIICTAVNSKKTIELDDFVTVEVSGDNGSGTARVSIDWDALDKEYGSKLSYSKAAQKAYGSMLSRATPLLYVKWSVDITLNQSHGLSNGDVISYTWYVDEQLSEFFNYKFKFTNKSFTVSGLK